MRLIESGTLVDIAAEVADNGPTGIRRVLTAINNFTPSQENFQRNRSVQYARFRVGTTIFDSIPFLYWSGLIYVPDGVPATITQAALRIPEHIGIGRGESMYLYATALGGSTNLAQNPTIRATLTTLAATTHSTANRIVNPLGTEVATSVALSDIAVAGSVITLHANTTVGAGNVSFDPLSFVVAVALRKLPV